MLKIKDNVDLKELAKFGFTYYEDKKFGNRWFYQSKSGGYIYVYEEDAVTPYGNYLAYPKRTLLLMANINCIEDKLLKQMCKILVKEDLVEKVDEEQ